MGSLCTRNARFDSGNGKASASYHTDVCQFRTNNTAMESTSLVQMHSTCQRHHTQHTIMFCCRRAYIVNMNHVQLKLNITAWPWTRPPDSAGDLTMPTVKIALVHKISRKFRWALPQGISDQQPVDSARSIIFVCYADLIHTWLSLHNQTPSNKFCKCCCRCSSEW